MLFELGQQGVDPGVGHVIPQPGLDPHPLEEIAGGGDGTVDTRLVTAAAQIPTRSAYCSNLARFCSRLACSRAGSTTARVWAWSRPCRAVIRGPACGWPSPGARGPDQPFSARVALHMMLARTSWFSGSTSALGPSSARVSSSPSAKRSCTLASTG